MLCLDASFLINALTSKLRPDDAERWELWLREGQELIAPRLARYEFANALHKARRKATISDELVRRTMQDMISLPIMYVDDDALPHEALTLADSLKMSASYDAHYVALAARFGADLWTSDRRLWEVASPRFPWVHYAPERLPGT
jgi:predicted nucleic acid-binding protein